MPSGLAALLDDVAAIARLAATSLDDVGAASAKAGTKAVGVVIDDAAVTPQYTNGLSPARELPIIWRIAKGSIFNKLVILLPAALLLGAFAPWAITPILMLGGTYLSYEGAEKVLEAIGLVGHHEEASHDEEAGMSPALLEETKAKGAIRTDLILSAEIMALALADVSDRSFVTQVVSLAIVAIFITALVYGAVGFIVKMDDMGLHLARKDSPFLKTFGRGLVKAMPMVLSTLGVVGIAAMMWVGGGIVAHGLDVFGLHTIPKTLHDASHAAGEAAPFAHGFFGWFAGAVGSALIGLILGSVLAFAIPVVRRAIGR